MGARSLNVHAFMPQSRSNGPGERAVLWVQGCSLRCKGCSNPGTHSFEPKHLLSVDAVFDRMRSLSPDVEGMTLTGGEPFDQAGSLVSLLQRVKEETLWSVLVFTGYELMEVLDQGPEQRKFLQYIDVLVAGRYDPSLRCRKPLRASSNQSLHFLTDRYGEEDCQNVPDAEVVISEEGIVTLTGVHPPSLKGFSWMDEERAS